EPMLMVAFINKPSNMNSDDVEYLWEYKRSNDNDWTVGRTWTAGSEGKSWEFKPTVATKYDIRVAIRKNGESERASEYALTSFQVNQVEDKTQNTSRPVDQIKTCNQIILHWDRLILYGDEVHKNQVYISDLNNPRYF